MSGGRESSSVRVRRCALVLATVVVASGVLLGLPTGADTDAPRGTNCHTLIQNRFDEEAQPSGPAVASPVDCFDARPLREGQLVELIVLAAGLGASFGRRRVVRLAGVGVALIAAASSAFNAIEVSIDRYNVPRWTGTPDVLIALLGVVGLGLLVRGRGCTAHKLSSV